MALKVLEPLASERQEREVEALRRIGPPAAPEVLGQGTSTSGEPVVVMERIDGLTLARRRAELPGPGALPWTEAAPRMLALAEALRHVHAAAVVHRDWASSTSSCCAAVPLRGRCGRGAAGPRVHPVEAHFDAGEEGDGFKAEALTQVD